MMVLSIFAIYVIGLLVTLKVYKKFFPRTPKEVVLITAVFWFVIAPFELFVVILKFIYKKI